MAEDVRLCSGQLSPISEDGRLLNHLPYAEAARADLIGPPRALRGQCHAIHRDMLSDLQALIALARSSPEVRDRIVTISCFRSRQHQTRIFCRPGRSILLQSYQVAPPGFSEHATGLAVDFGDNRAGRCNLEACFARTIVGRWLAQHAPAFGFEMSFPEGNAQGVAFEPWHWRWVGRGDARGPDYFATARGRFPARGAAQASSVRQLVDPAATLSLAEPTGGTE
ncbi:MAG TPA: M15 family metallopeptidase [Allosphingosinicella sp.]|nr:M15 family metallopeptidase [Allosphingosinicella sp.]